VPGLILTPVCLKSLETRYRSRFTLHFPVLCPILRPAGLGRMGAYDHLSCLHLGSRTLADVGMISPPGLPWMPRIARLPA
jgi:hypothetical protein